MAGGQNQKKIDPLRRCIFMVHAHAARGTAAHRFPLSVGASRSYGVTASTLDSESSDRGSNPREALWVKVRKRHVTVRVSR